MLTALDSQPRTANDAADRFDAIARMPFGFVGVLARGQFIEEICFLTGDVHPKRSTNPVAQTAIDQIAAYCVDCSTLIELPLAIKGTDFQRRVWDQIALIPPGSTRTYGELAHRLEGEARAVGQACGDNRLPLAIPCHRVVAAGGIGGFAHHRGGAYERIKRWLLMHEAGAEFRLT